MLRKQFISNLAKLVPAAALAPQYLLAQERRSVQESAIMVLGSAETAGRFGRDAFRISPAALLQIRTTGEGFECVDIFGKTIRASRVVFEGKVKFDIHANTVQLEHAGMHTTLQLCCSRSPESPVLLCAQKQYFDEASAQRFVKRKGNGLLLLS